jgi:hypothetical protein
VKLRRRHVFMMGAGAAALIFCTLISVYSAVACPLHHRPEEPLCLSIADGKSIIFSLRLARHDMFDPPPHDLRLAKGLINNTEPALGLSYNEGHHTVVNMQGTVAGFFTAMHLTYDPNAGTGSGRVVGELQAHPLVTLAEVSCH